MLQVNFIMICIIRKISVLLKITRISKRFLNSIIEFYFLKDNQFFSEHIMMKSPSLEEENIIKDVRNLFRLGKLKKQTIGSTVNRTRNLFRLEKENEVVKDRILRNARNLFRLEKENKVIKDIILRDNGNLSEHEEEEKLL